MPRPPGPNPATTDRLYDAEEAEFLAAMARYQREKKRPFPTWSEALAVARGLGYRKVADPLPQPGPAGGAA